MDHKLIIVHGSRYEELDEKLASERGIELKRTSEQSSSPFLLLRGRMESLIISGPLYEILNGQPCSVPLSQMLEYADEVHYSGSSCDECGVEKAVMKLQDKEWCPDCCRHLHVKAPPRVSVTGRLLVIKSGEECEVTLALDLLGSSKKRKGTDLITTTIEAVNDSVSSLTGPGLYTYIVMAPRIYSSEDLITISSNVKNIVLKWQ